MSTVNKVPTYRLHKARRCAVVTVRGRNHYLGKYGSPESYEKYSRVIAEWKGGAGVGDQRPTSEGLLVLELINAPRKWAEDHYTKDS